MCLWACRFHPETFAEHEPLCTCQACKDNQSLWWVGKTFHYSNMNRSHVGSPEKVPHSWLVNQLPFNPNNFHQLTEAAWQIYFNCRLITILSKEPREKLMNNHVGRITGTTIWSAEFKAGFCGFPNSYKCKKHPVCISNFILFVMLSFVLHTMMASPAPPPTPHDQSYRLLRVLLLGPFCSIDLLIS